MLFAVPLRQPSPLRSQMNGFLHYGIHFAKFLIKRDLKHLIVHVTNHCNFRCDHCFIDFSPKQDMKLDYYQELGRKVGSLFWLDIGGGEPFLREDLAEIIAAFDCRIIQIPSNGSLPDQMIEQVQRMKSFRDREVVISLSLDGPREVHDSIRGQAGSYDQVWETARRLKEEAGTYVKILSVLQQSNADTIIPFMEEVKKWKPDYHSVILFRGEGLNKDVCLPPLDKLKELGPRIQKMQESYDYGTSGLAMNFIRNFHRFVWKTSIRILEEERQVIPCLGGQSHMVVYGNGDVSSCEMLAPVGNIQTKSWSKITNDEAFRQQVQDIKDGKCHCTHNCALMDSVLFNPMNIPNLLRQC